MLKLIFLIVVLFQVAPSHVLMCIDLMDKQAILLQNVEVKTCFPTIYDLHKIGIAMECKIRQI